MGKFMHAKFDSKCAQTSMKIKKGDHIYYHPGFGAYAENSKVYQEHKGNNSIADHIQANEEAYFDNFCSKNNI
jgi:hypothetical protein